MDLNLNQGSMSLRRDVADDTGKVAAGNVTAESGTPGNDSEGWLDIILLGGFCKCCCIFWLLLKGEEAICWGRFANVVALSKVDIDAFQDV